MKKSRKKLLFTAIILIFAILFILNKLVLQKQQNIIGEDAIDVPILLYHHLLTDEENTYGDNSAILSVDTFRQHMKLLYDNGYNTIKLDELEKFVKGEISLPRKSVLITFDDGYKSNYEYAYPILKEYGFNAAIFLISGWNTDEVVAFDPNQLQYLSWAEIEKSRDVFEYASHTHDLHRLSENQQGYLVTKPSDEVEDDLKKSMESIDTAYLAYPYGHYNRETLDILEQLGYRMAFTVEMGRVRPGDPMLELSRYGIFPDTSLQKFKQIVGL